MLPSANPIILGVLLLAAVGTAVYTYCSSRETPQQNRYRYGPDDYDRDYIASYPSITRTTDDDEGSHKRGRKRGESCTICLAILEKNLRTLACGHIFHSLCINSWFTQKKNCPICRQDVA